MVRSCDAYCLPPPNSLGNEIMMLFSEHLRSPKVTKIEKIKTKKRFCEFGGIRNEAGSHVSRKVRVAYFVTKGYEINIETLSVRWIKVP